MKTIIPIQSHNNNSQASNEGHSNKTPLKNLNCLVERQSTGHITHIILIHLEIIEIIVNEIQLIFSNQCG